MTEKITGEIFKNMIMNAAAAVESNKQEINDLNVYPVPDGDTGTNMSLTIGAAERALAAISPNSLGQAAEVAASAMVRGARGNSGVILSLLFRGLSRRLKDTLTADSAAFSAALVSGVDSAYKAVMKPAEGTILTVSRLAAGAAVIASENEADLELVFASALAEGEKALADTINLNPVLQKAGVIDAGGKGYIYILDGMLDALRGNMLARTVTYADEIAKADFSLFAADDITFVYCTEFVIEKTISSDFESLREFLDERGDSIVLVDDDEIIKVHIHTNDPGIVLTEALTHGALLSIKIENMRQQHTETLQTDDFEDYAPPYEREEMKEFGFVAVCAGSGIEDVFRDLGTDGLITGGQTMNPSTEDILEIINRTPSDVVFVLPNNKNIIMAAEQCITLTKKRIIVIPTRSIPQGVSAMLASDGLSDIEELQESMTKAAERVKTALITHAVRDSIYEDMNINEGEYIAMLDDALISGSPDLDALIDTVAARLDGFSPEFITIYAGEDVSAEDAASTSARINAISPAADTTLILGGQPIYNYIISAE